MRSRQRGVRRWSNATFVLVAALAVLLILRAVSEREPTPGDVVGREGPHAVRRVIDGDTLLLDSGQRVRLIGVDTPETKHPDLPVDPLGEEATRFVERLIASKPVRLEFDRERLDRYRRLLAYVYLADGRLLNAELIRAGYSEAETGYSYRQDRKREFLAAEEDARRAGRGRWATSIEGVASPQVHSQ